MSSGAGHHLFKEEKTQEKPLGNHMLVMVTKKGQVGSNGLQPTMGPEDGPGACWRTRMLPPSTSSVSRSINLRPRLGSPQQPGGRRHPPRQEVPKPLLHQQRAIHNPSHPLRTRTLWPLSEKQTLSLPPRQLAVVRLSKPLLVALIVQTQFLFFLPRVLCGHRC